MATMALDRQLAPSQRQLPAPPALGLEMVLEEPEMALEVDQVEQALVGLVVLEALEMVLEMDRTLYQEPSQTRYRALFQEQA